MCVSGFLCAVYIFHHICQKCIFSILFSPRRKKVFAILSYERLTYIIPYMILEGSYPGNEQFDTYHDFLALKLNSLQPEMLPLTPSFSLILWIIKSNRILQDLKMLHYFDFPRLLVCYLGIHFELKKLYFIFVAICGGSITIFPGL